jgi:hypothetical protein
MKLQKSLNTISLSRKSAVGQFANRPTGIALFLASKKGLMPLTCHASGGATGS